MIGTGYTHPVMDGKITTLREFILTCARGMGACIMMRDEPFGAPIPVRFEPNTAYHDERLVSARALLTEVMALTDAECAERALVANQKAVAEHTQHAAEEQASYARAKAMRAAVEGWKTDAEGIREFALQQLSVTLERGPYEPTPPVALSASEWRAQTLDKASRDIGYHETKRAEEIVRTEERNRWLTQLRASLPDEGGKG